MQRLYYVRRREVVAIIPFQTLTPQSEPAGAAPAFLPVRVVDLVEVAPRTAPPIEIVLPAGPTVRVPHGFDPRTLGEVLAVLEGRPC